MSLSLVTNKNKQNQSRTSAIMEAPQLGPHQFMGRGREMGLKYTTLSCLSSGLIGFYTVVDLRNDSTVNGKLEATDGCMNLTLSNAIHTDPDGNEHFYETFFIRERNIRHVHIPPGMTAQDAINKGLYNLRRPKQVKPRSLKQSRLMQRQIETKKRAEEIKMEKLKKKEQKED